MSSIHSQDDDKIDVLPNYQNDIYLFEVMPRKMEYVLPGIPAKDRKWRKVICVLEGTAFRVYQCPNGPSALSRLTSWCQSKLWANAKANTRPKAEIPDETQLLDAAALTCFQRTRFIKGGTSLSLQFAQSMPNLAPPRGDAHSLWNLYTPGGEAPPYPGYEASDITASASASVTCHGTYSTGHGHSGTETESISHSHLQPPQRHSSVQSHTSTQRSRATSIQTTNKTYVMNNELPPELEYATLLRSYTMQHAESGVGIDYRTKKNVMRLRMEGEQFLLQARDLADMVRWIEGLQAASNIALDLDVRPMPREPLRKRRRMRLAAAAMARQENQSRVR